ncbi:MAG TPA: DNA polymerase Y family protein [Candidatus Dormibacteraeota bacterium]|nr:DNA polymerase Y family protein [Candidatus Dormibacteraeota bacterium]
MAFASIFVPNFRVQAVVRVEPELRGRALALVDGAPPLCNVVAVNERAARMGVETGMTKTNAEQFAGLEIRARSAALEKSAHAALLDAGWSVSPRIEDAGEDGIVIDIAGLGSLFGGEAEIGGELERRAFACGLEAHVAIAGNIDAASIAARGCGGVTVIPRGEEAARLSGLPMRVLGPAEETAETLRRWGMHTCGALAALPVGQLSERLGQEGVRLHALARGASVRSLTLAAAVDFFEEEMELDDAVEELDPLSFLLGRLLDQLCARLGARALAASLIRVRFELQPHFENACDRRKEVVRQKNPPGEYETELRLPVPARDAKMLLKLLRLRLQAHPPGAPVQKIVMRAEAARPRAMQGGLFLPSFPDPEKLELTIARIANVVGEANVGSPEIVDSHRPGTFQMGKFRAASDGAEGVREGSVRRPDARDEKNASANGAGDAGDVDGEDAHRKVTQSFRAFRPEIPARMELQGGRPMAVNFQGARGEVRAASGPWRTSGNWWREDSWRQEEWDLEVKFRPPQHVQSRHVLGTPVRAEGSAISAETQIACGKSGVYRVYYDAEKRGWFVRGVFD